MSLATSLALLALLVAVFAVLAVGAVYIRVRRLEATALTPGSARLADEPRLVPGALAPEPGQRAALVVLLDGTCAICHALWDAVTAAHLPQVRVLGLLPDETAAGTFEGGTVLADPGLWSSLYEGYTPCLYVIDTSGALTDRRFVYGDTDVPALLAELVPAAPEPAASSQGSAHAS
ncbi:hypothetical protein [Sphaerisporangium fuscum]|uniref:hypothetical protein n=1 Tax=Sphaerisporangium fuscum TaxID=2835868 RepID=UPI001BDD2A69|nr:hypothetical protein [Sphaerisporangium fuscum]